MARENEYTSNIESRSVNGKFYVHNVEGIWRGSEGKMLIAFDVKVGRKFLD